LDLGRGQGADDILGTHRGQVKGKGGTVCAGGVCSSCSGTQLKNISKREPVTVEAVRFTGFAIQVRKGCAGCSVRKRQLLRAFQHRLADGGDLKFLEGFGDRLNHGDGSQVHLVDFLLHTSDLCSVGGIELLDILVDLLGFVRLLLDCFLQSQRLVVLGLGLLQDCVVL